MEITPRSHPVPEGRRELLSEAFFRTGREWLVRAVLAPKRAHDAELGERRRAAEHRERVDRIQRVIPCSATRAG